MIIVYEERTKGFSDKAGFKHFFPPLCPFSGCNQRMYFVEAKEQNRRKGKPRIPEIRTYKGNCRMLATAWKGSWKALGRMLRRENQNNTFPDVFTPRRGLEFHLWVTEGY